MVNTFDRIDDVIWGLGLQNPEILAPPIEEYWALWQEQLEDHWADIQQAVADKITQYRARSERGILDGGERSILTMVVIGAAEEVNDWARTTTGNEIDLGMLIPLLFGAIALRQFWEQGFRVNDIPWYVPAWYAFDTFIKLNFPDHNGRLRGETPIRDAPPQESPSP